MNESESSEQPQDLFIPPWMEREVSQYCHAWQHRYDAKRECARIGNRMDVELLMKYGKDV